MAKRENVNSGKRGGSGGTRPVGRTEGYGAVRGGFSQTKPSHPSRTHANNSAYKKGPSISKRKR